MKANKWMRQALVLGTVFFIAAFLVKPVGVSTQFSVVSGIIHSSVQPDLIIEDDTRENGYRSTNEYYDKDDGKLANHIKNPLNYDFVFVLAIPLGGYLGYWLRKKRNKDSMNKETANIEASCEIPKAKKNFIRVYLPSFIGGFLLLYGARMAGGCTSGHMMSGMMQGAVSGYLFAASVFIVAIPTAIISQRNKWKKGEKR